MNKKLIAREMAFYLKISPERFLELTKILGIKGECKRTRLGGVPFALYPISTLPIFRREIQKQEEATKQIKRSYNKEFIDNERRIMKARKENG